MTATALSDYIVGHPVLLTTTLLAVGVAYLVQAQKQTRAPWRGALPILQFPVNPLNSWGSVLPYRKWFPNFTMLWAERKYTYKDAEMIAVSGTLYGGTVLFTNAPEVFRQVLSNKAPFLKGRAPPLEIMGENVISTDGEAWQVQRRAAAPAFSVDAYRQVWAETIRTFHEMSAGEGWDGPDVVDVAEPNVITRRIALFIIASCGFNIPLSWTDSDVDADGQMSLRAVLSNVANSVIARAVAPRWVYYLPFEGLKRIETAYTRLQLFLDERIKVRKAEIRAELDTQTESVESNRDLFSRFVASGFREGKKRFSDRHIIGNTFITLFAGHETTAHSLACTLIMLGLYEEEQARVYKHIVDVVGDRVPTFEDYEALEQVILAAVYETIRIFPPAYMQVRLADKDTSLAVPHKDGSGSKDVFLPKGTYIVLDMVGAGCNERAYPDANAFKPARFDHAGAHDMSLAFSYGPRICLGKRFATTEMVCFLTLLLREWEVRVPRDEARETREQWRERMMQPTLGLSMVMPQLPLRLVRRKS